jgi:CRISPR-associated protein Csc3
MNNDFDFLDGDFGFDEDSDVFGGLSQRALTSTQHELLTLKRLREAIQSQNPDDAVMR